MAQNLGANINEGTVLTWPLMQMMMMSIMFIKITDALTELFGVLNLKEKA
jgi:hypothetical protein